MHMMNPAASAQRSIDLAWCLIVMAGVMLAYNLAPDLALAQGPTERTGIDQALCNIYNGFTGTTGRVLASLAIIIVGIGALMGKISWGMALIVAIGVALVFGAASIVNLVANNIDGVGAATGNANGFCQ